MILTVDLNPRMDRKYTLDKIYVGKDTKAKSLIYNPGGNGMVATTLLYTFNEKSFMTGFLGGVNGEYFHKKLIEKSIMHEFVPIKEETATNIKLIDEGENCTTISEEGPRITREEVVNFYELYSNLVENANIICGLGDILPLGVPKDIYFDLISMANKKNKKFILDIGGEELSYGIDASPYMVIIRQSELEDLTRLSLTFENEIIKAGRYILDKDVEFVIIDLKNKGSIVLGQEKGYRVEIPYYSRKNGEDYRGMSSGFAIGINRNYDIEMTLKLGQAFDIAANSISDIMTVEISDIKRIMSEIEIYPINY